MIGSEQFIRKQFDFLGPEEVDRVLNTEFNYLPITVFSAIAAILRKILPKVK